jgi:DNA-binding response OmpR family regulator/HD superfamily phosphohydrolase YqeK
MDKDTSSRVLIAEDDETSRLVLEKSLDKWGYEVVVACDGNEALERFQEPTAPKLAILDWMMPGLDGIDVCRKIREVKTLIPPHVIMLTSRDEKKDVVTGLEAGANDFVPKPFDKDELRARLEVGRRSVELQTALVNSIKKQEGGSFKEKEEMEQTIVALKKRADELEASLSAAAKSDDQTALADTSANILDEIVFVFKRGEIHLPSPPQIGIRFKEMMNTGANLQQIAGILRQDVAVSSKLISISNSAFYRGVAENQTLDQAVGRLGLQTTKQYVDAITNRSLYYTKNKNLKDLVEKLWEHSLSCAYASQTVAQILKFKLAEDTFTLGLLHDIGRLVLLQAVGELQLKKKLGENIENVELFETIDKNHGKFGAALLKKWKFSDDFIHVANFHDHLEGCEAISNSLLVVNLANLVVKTLGYSMSDVGDIDLEGSRSARLLNVDSEVISRVRDRVKTHMEDLKEFFV